LIQHVIPDGREAADRESTMSSAGARNSWIPGQTSGLPGMTGRIDQPDSV
jgi:hypothetical protein